MIVSFCSRQEWIHVRKKEKYPPACYVLFIYCFFSFFLSLFSFLPHFFAADRRQQKLWWRAS